MSHSLILAADPECLDIAMSELRRADSSARLTARLDDGTILIDTTLDFADIASQWRNPPPVFVRHVCPVERVCDIPADAAGIVDTVSACGSELCSGRLRAPARFSVQTRVFGEVPAKPFEIGGRLAPALAVDGAVLDVKDPQWVLSVVICQSKAYLGLSSVEQNLSGWAGGMRRFAREEGQVSRAEFKLLEAIETFSIRLRDSGAALDLGAAPGGWSRVLRARGMRVTAVDPAALDQSVIASGVRHVRSTAQEFVRRSRAERFDCIVNDMRQDARDSARMMLDFAGMLAPDGVFVMTLKLARERRMHTIDQALGIIEERFEIRGLRHLFHNRSEVTVWGGPASRV